MGIGIVVLVLVVDVVLLVVVLVVVLVDVVLLVEGDAVELGATVVGVDTTGVEALDSASPVVAVSDPQDAAIIATPVSASASGANRFTGLTVPVDLGATLAT